MEVRDAGAVADDVEIDHYQDCCAGIGEESWGGGDIRTVRDGWVYLLGN